MGEICYLDFSGGGKSFLKPKEKDPEPDYNLPKKDFRKGKGENTTSNFASKNFKRETASSSKKVFIKS